MRVAALLAIVALGCAGCSNTDQPDPDLLYGIAHACPAGVVAATSPEAGTRLQYPMTYVAVVAGTEPASPFAAEWTGIRRLETPIVRECLDAFVTDPPGLPCRVETVVELTLADDTLLEIAVGLAFEDLAPFADGRSVSVLLGEMISMTGGVPVTNPSRQLEIREGDTGPLLAAIGREPADVYGSAGTDSLDDVGWIWDGVQLGFGDILCVTEGDFCRRVHASRALTVTTPGATESLEPGDSVQVTSGGLDYRVTFRRGTERLYGVIPGGECGDRTWPTASVELVRLP